MLAVTSSSDSASGAESSLTWIKADFHLHTAEDPFDDVDFTAFELLDRAHELGFRAVAITLHQRVFHDERVFARARELGVLLIQAAELRIEQADVVVLNITPDEAAGVQTFEDLRDLRRRRGDTIFVFAPHPYYVLGGSIGERAEAHIDCFDAIEFCHFHVPMLNPNRRAMRLARKHAKPLLATSDTHWRRFFGTHYSLLGLAPTNEPPTIDQVFAAMRADRIRLVSPSGGLLRFVLSLFFILVVTPFLRRLPGSKRSLARREWAARRARQRELSLAAGARIDPSVNL